MFNTYVDDGSVCTQLLLDRKFNNGRTLESVPLLFLIGASNESPTNDDFPMQVLL
jgi:hypothetical protein